jgi:uncharacterized protein (TIGR02600 family)
MLALLSIIVVAFLSSVSTDLSASKSYEDQVGARALADSAVNLVIAQIREASTQPKKAWISQPGLIRTFSEAPASGGAGKPEKIFKLYSDTTMQETGAAASGFDPSNQANQPDQDWALKPNLYTDLNAPVSKGNAVVFPILDGNKMVSSNVNGQQAWIYDSDTDGKPDVEGFSVDSSKVKYSGGVPSPYNNPVPMPVKWLYMLKDGTLVPAKERPGGYDVEVGGSTKVTKTNPIIARVAFWTDDETCKVNINTASEGTYWDTPTAVSYPASGNWTSPDFDPKYMCESDLAWRQAAQREYQRYPGHPATTCLSTVLGSALSKALSPVVPANPRSQDRSRLVLAITDIVPRITDDTKPTAGKGPFSSMAGTRRPPTGAGTADETVFATAQKVPIDSDRLFATPDELFFRVATSAELADSTLNGRKSQEKDTALSKVSADDLKALVNRSRFFLTATSKAPELNVFNKPRITVWPINVDPAKRTTADRLFAFCGSIGNYVAGSIPKTTKIDAPIFFFSRDKYNLQSNDLPTGGTVRNNQLMTYLQTLTDSPFPGFAGQTFRQKYGDDRDQILMEMFDYIRCTNLLDLSEATSASSKVSTAYSMPTPTSPDDLKTSDRKGGMVVPIANPTTKLRGFGRMATISEMGLVLIKTFENTATPTQTKLELTLIPELFCPMAGYTAMADDISLKFTGLENITVSVGGRAPITPFAQPPGGIPGKPVTHEMYLPGRIPNGAGRSSKIGGYMGIGTLFELANRYPASPTNTETPTMPPNAHFQVDARSGEFITISGAFKVEVYCNSTKTLASESTRPLQTFTFNLPLQEMPIPRFSGVGGSNVQELTKPVGSGASAYPSAGYAGKGYRMTAGGANGTAPQAQKLQVNWSVKNPPGTAGTMFTFEDMIRSLVLNGTTESGKPIMGDVRLVAAKSDIPSSYFVPAKNYTNRNVLQAHSLRKSFFASASICPLPGGVSGTLIPVTQTVDHSNPAFPAEQMVDPSFAPDMPNGVSEVKNSLGYPGDWDNGPALMQDGPFVNKADEGVPPASFQTIPYIQSFYDADSQDAASGTFFSPNRLIPSPVMFGSLSTGVKRGYPWQTLLFRPDVNYLPGNGKHPGGTSSGTFLPDHLLLDLFWMPVVEPYAISEPFATSGKINLNYQIAPFTYIKRDTGVRAVLKSTMITALNPDDKAGGAPFLNGYKNPSDPSGSNKGVNTRIAVNLDETMSLIDKSRFSQNKPFIAASEICDIPLVPQGITSAGLSSFWTTHKLTGDNSLERPYATIYPRLTTKSNSYTVHVRVQTLKKAPADVDQAVFKDGRDQVLSEFRGSFVIERYLDANTAGFYGGDGKVIPSGGEINSNAVLGPYKFRVVSSKQFGL